jgi:hypothetical protein
MYGFAASSTDERQCPFDVPASAGRPGVDSNSFRNDWNGLTALQPFFAFGR